LTLFTFCCSPENHENPFIADGELRRKADYIIQYSTISRRRIRIADPDCTPPPLPDSHRDAGSPSVSQPALDNVDLILDAVDRSPALVEAEQVGKDSACLSTLTGPGGSGNHSGVDRQRQRTPSPTESAAAVDGDADGNGKAETSTSELDRPTTCLLHGVASSSQGRRRRCHCCAVQ